MPTESFKNEGFWLGVEWWHGLSEANQNEWLKRANSTSPADAWAAFRRRILELEGFLPAHEALPKNA
jgi:hypothetical protein